MSFTTFLLRLVGRAPDQLEEQRRFEENLKKLDRRDVELDELVAEIREIDQAVQEKTEALAVVTSIRPIPHEQHEESDDRAIEEGKL